MEPLEKTLEVLPAKDARKRALQNALRTNAQFASIMECIEKASATEFSFKAELAEPPTQATLLALKAAEYKVQARANNVLDITWS